MASPRRSSTTADDWFGLLSALGLRLRIPEVARERLWAKVTAAHAVWAEHAA